MSLHSILPETFEFLLTWLCNSFLNIALLSELHLSYLFVFWVDSSHDVPIELFHLHFVLVWVLMLPHSELYSESRKYI